MCTAMSLAGKAWMLKSNFDDNVAISSYTDNQLATISFFTYFLLLNTLLPISL